MNALLAALLLAPSVLDVSVDPAIDDAAHVRDWVEKEGAAVLQERGVEATASEKAWRIAIAITGSDYDYHVELELERAGAPLADPPAPFGCQCNNEQLIEKIEAAIGSAIDTLEREPEPAPPSPKAVEATPATDELQPQRKIGPMGVTGAVLIPVGAAGAIAGGVLLGRGEVVDDSGEARETTDFRPVGIGLVAAGSAVLVTGVVLLIADRVRARRRGVVAAAAGLGVVVRGRF